PNNFSEHDFLRTKKHSVTMKHGHLDCGGHAKGFRAV
nr:hypothetical protein [Tanacetum cinerariifolium]